MTCKLLNLGQVDYCQLKGDSKSKGNLPISPLSRTSAICPNVTQGKKAVITAAKKHKFAVVRLVKRVFVFSFLFNLHP